MIINYGRMDIDYWLTPKKFIERRGNLFLEGKRVEVIVREREEL